MSDGMSIFNYFKNENNIIKFCTIVLEKYNNFGDIIDVVYDIRKTASGEMKSIRINFLYFYDNNLSTALSVSHKGDIKWMTGIDEIKEYLFTEVRDNKLKEMLG